MSEYFGQRLNVHAALQCACRERVAKRVKILARNSEPRLQSVETPLICSNRNNPLARRRNYVFGLAATLDVFQMLDQLFRQRDDTPRSFSFRYVRYTRKLACIVLDVVTCLIYRLGRFLKSISCHVSARSSPILKPVYGHGTTPNILGLPPLMIAYSISRCPFTEKHVTCFSLCFGRLILSEIYSAISPMS